MKKIQEVPAHSIEAGDVVPNWYGSGAFATVISARSVRAGVYVKVNSNPGSKMYPVGKMVEVLR